MGHVEVNGEPINIPDTSGMYTLSGKHFWKISKDSIPPKLKRYEITQEFIIWTPPGAKFVDIPNEGIGRVEVNGNYYAIPDEIGEYELTSDGFKTTDIDMPLRLQKTQFKKNLIRYTIDKLVLWYPLDARLIRGSNSDEIKYVKIDERLYDIPTKSGEYQFFGNRFWRIKDNSKLRTGDKKYEISCKYRMFTLWCPYGTKFIREKEIRSEDYAKIYTSSQTRQQAVKGESELAQGSKKKAV